VSGRFGSTRIKARLQECRTRVRQASGFSRHGAASARTPRRTHGRGRTARQVIWMVLRDSLILTAIGAMIGVPLALLTGRALASALFDVKPNDLPSVLFALGGIAAVAVGGSFIPARRAAAIDPLTALRSE